MDFGLESEFMLPLRTFRRFTVDPLSGLVGALENLKGGEIGTLLEEAPAAPYRPVERPEAPETGETPGRAEEEPVAGGAGHVDVSLKRDEYALAYEISVTSSPEQELSNVRKCLEAGFDEVAVVSDAEDRLERTKVYITDHLEETEADRVHFLTPDAFFELLEKREAETRGEKQTVGDYKVRVEYETVGEEEKKTRSDTIWKTIIKGFRRLREDDS